MKFIKPSSLFLSTAFVGFLALPLWGAVPPALTELATDGATAVEEAEARMGAAADADDADAMAEAREALNNAVVIRGSDGWLFGLNDVRHHAAGPFWGDRAAEVAASSRNPDPLPAIVGMAEQASAAGVRLIVLPVPSKVSAYPEKLDPALEGWTDEARAAFLEELAEAGVDVLDATDLLGELRAEGHLSHMRTDAHWSPLAVEKVAAQIYEMVKDEDWVGELDRAEVSLEETTLSVTGDLASQIGEEKETITVNQVSLGGERVRSNQESPIVLMGDSHGLVYGHRDLLTTRAGLGDHLAAQFGIAPDITAVMGSGANASRMSLARRGDSLEGKKLVIWVFAEREFSRSGSGWPVIPVVR
ncbi:MAG: hypothetical protein JJT75_12265 [Opitutales bacterium]|nr:hypothetical protein [Opitutales bacterium]MCH8539814.1 hypothetical protein [Opitutales bacterium]